MIFSRIQEFLTINPPYFSLMKSEGLLDAFGSDGWEVVQVDRNDIDDKQVKVGQLWSCCLILEYTGRNTSAFPLPIKIGYLPATRIYVNFSWIELYTPVFLLLIYGRNGTC